MSALGTDNLDNPIAAQPTISRQKEHATPLDQGFNKIVSLPISVSGPVLPQRDFQSVPESHQDALCKLPVTFSAE